MLKKAKEHLSKVKFEAKIQNLENEKKDIEQKYLKLLEEEHEFVELVKVQIDNNKKLGDENRELKKQLALSNETIEELNSEVLKLDKRYKRLKEKNKENNGN